MSLWSIVYNGVTQDVTSWIVASLQRDRKPGPGKVTFSLPSVPFDISVLPFQWKKPLSILRDGKPWFSGWVTKPEPNATGQREAINYEITDVLYWFEQTAFQQQWTQINPGSGSATTTGTTTQSEVILSQSLDGFKMGTGDVIREALIYMLYALQGTPFPSTVDVNHLPPMPTGTLAFTIGRIDPDIDIPYSQVKDKKCLDVIRLLLKYSPDCLLWVDYSTSPVTINVTRQANMAKRTVTVEGGPVAIKGFNPTPRYDLQLPGVIVKFQQPDVVNGQSVSNIIVQKYPASVPDNAPGVWVQTIDLVGPQTTLQTADIQVRARPGNVAAGGKPAAITMDWIFYKEPWLKQQLGTGASAPYIWDWDNVGCYYLNTVLDPNDPLAKTDPQPEAVKDGFNLDCHTLDNEIVTGQVAPWMYDSDGILAAKVRMEVWLNYTGNDPATAKLFTFDPSNPGTPKADGTGYFVLWIDANVTNADTQSYSYVTAKSAGEPVPQGLAQSFYEAMSVLRYQGKLTIVEQECSDLLPLGCTFNTTDGNPAWKSANFIVLTVKEDVFKGVTTVEFGPPSVLGLDGMAELFRLNFGRLPAFKLDQRTSGLTTAGANVQSATHGADTKSTMVPMVSSGGILSPLNLQDASATGVCKIAVIPGMVGGIPLTGSPLTVSPGTGAVYVSQSFTYDALNNRTITSTALMTTTGTVPGMTCSGGSGTFNYQLGSYTASVTAGNASTKVSSFIGASLEYSICNGAINGPWGLGS